MNNKNSEHVLWFDWTESHQLIQRFIEKQLIDLNSIEKSMSHIRLESKLLFSIHLRWNEMKWLHCEY